MGKRPVAVNSERVKFKPGEKEIGQEVARDKESAAASSDCQLHA